MGDSLALDTAAAAAQEQLDPTRSADGTTIFCAQPKMTAEDRAAEVARKVKDRDRKAAKSCNKAALAKYGVRPRNLFAYLDSPKEPALAKAVLDASNQQISPEFLYAVAMGEGLNDYFDSGGKKARKGQARVSGFLHVGLDDFGRDAEELKENGYLRPDFKKGSDYTPKGEVNEDGERKNSATFSNLPVSLEAVGAELKWRRDVFLEDASSVLGQEATDKLTPEEIDYWTYSYFNAGIERGKKLLTKRKSAAIRKWTKDPEGEGGGYSRNAHSNALIRVATMEYLRCTGVFESQQQPCAEPPTQNTASSNPRIGPPL